jgi:hypothetical protein
MPKVGDVVRVIKNDNSSYMADKFLGHLGIVCEKHGNECTLYFKGIGEVSWFLTSEVETVRQITPLELFAYLEDDKVVLDMNEDNPFPLIKIEEGIFKRNESK